MLKVISLCVLQSVLLTGAQVFLKFALVKMPKFAWTKQFWAELLVNWQFAVSGILFAAASLLWMYIIKHFPFSTAYPMISLCYVFGMIAAIAFFHESVSISKWIGVALIMIGCIFIAR